MKYMGSKSNMLLNGLATIFYNEIQNKTRVIDLMCGSASVAWYIAQNFEVKVIAIDLQKYSQILANSILKRTKKILVDKLWKEWYENYNKLISNHPYYVEALQLDKKKLSIYKWSEKARKLCSLQSDGVVWNSYGGYYYSPLQALKLDILLNSIPYNVPKSYIAHAAVIIAASHCSASPGHTAQSFKPNETAGVYLKEAWKKDPIFYAERAFKSIGEKFSKQLGEAYVMDAMDFTKHLTEQDLVFIDPPYSSVHYSRFYHVLETIARGFVGEISGVGRYPPQKERPFSVFSRKSESEINFRKLIELISKKKAKVILTYPDKECSNGLSGDKVLEVCSNFFNIKKKIVNSNFSTLGGNNKIRSARRKTGEMILVLEKL